MSILRQLKRENLYERVAEEIKAYILENKLSAGDKLPPERELARLLGVSRTSVREGIRLLETLQFVSVKPKEGIIVKGVELTPVIEQLSFRLMQSQPRIRELAEARKLIEMDILDLAVERATETELSEMRASIERMQKKAEAGEDYLSEDLAFHEALMRAAKNEVLRGFGSVLRDFFAALPREGLDFGKAGRSTLKDHRAIYEAIRRRDLEGARRAMEGHLATYDRFLKKNDDKGRE